MIMTRKQFDFLKSKNLKEITDDDFNYLSGILETDLTRYNGFNNLVLDNEGKVICLIKNPLDYYEIYITDGYGYVSIIDLDYYLEGEDPSRLSLQKMASIVYLNELHYDVCGNSISFEKGGDVYIAYIGDDYGVYSIMKNGKEINSGFYSFLYKNGINFIVSNALKKYEGTELDEYEDQSAEELKSYSETEFAEIIEKYGNLFKIVEESECKDSYMELLNLLKRARN